jgi:hypothetical protein
MIEFLPETISIAALKKKLIAVNLNQNLITLNQFYRWYFGDKFEEA